MTFNIKRLVSLGNPQPPHKIPKLMGRRESERASPKSQKNEMKPFIKRDINKVKIKHGTNSNKERDEEPGIKGD